MRALSFAAASLIIAALPLFTITNQAGAADKMIYWNNGGGIFRSNLNGTGARQIAAASGDSWGLAIDSSAGKVYWTEYGSGKIRRSNLDGSHIEDVFTGLTDPWNIALDASASKIYWTDDYGVKCANLNGSNKHSIYTSSFYGSSFGIALDALDGKVYWSDFSDSGYGIIKCSNLDGSDAETVISGLDFAIGLAIDAEQDALFWTEAEGSVGFANLDGSNLQRLYMGDAIGIAVDPYADKLYWSNSYGIGRMNFDYSGIEYVISGDFAASIAIGPVPEPCTLLLLGLGAVIVGKRRG